MPDFIPAQPSAPAIWLSKLLWPMVVRVRHQVVGLRVLADGLQKFKAVRDRRVIVCPNHPTMADSDIMFLFSGLVGENFRFLAAREIFRTHHGANGYLLSRGGCCSIRRGLPDRPSFRAVTADLSSNRAKVVIFPEGELSHDFCELMPLEPGAAQMGFWALQDLEQSGSSEDLFVLPTALTYAYIEDPTSCFDSALRKLEESLALPPAADVTRQQRLKRVSEHLLMVLEESYDLHCNNNTLDSRLAAMRRSILARLVALLGCKESASEIDLMHLVRDRLDHFRYGANVRGRYAERIGQENALLASLLTKDLHRVTNLRFCLSKCTGDYASQEIGEALSLLEYEVLGKALPSAKRLALISVGEAINLKPRLAAYKRDRRGALQQVTNEIAGQLKSMQVDLALEIRRLEASAFLERVPADGSCAVAISPP